MKLPKVALPRRGPHPSSDPSLKDWFDKEFHHAAEEKTPGGVLWSPQWGCSGVENGGLIDYYLKKKRWGVDFVHQGDNDRLRTHYEQFLKGGNYHQWIVDDSLSEWALVDFRKGLPTVPHTGQVMIIIKLIERANAFLRL